MWNVKTIVFKDIIGTKLRSNSLETVKRLVSESWLCESRLYHSHLWEKSTFWWRYWVNNSSALPISPTRKWIFANKIKDFCQKWIFAHKTIILIELKYSKSIIFLYYIFIVFYFVFFTLFYTMTQTQLKLQLLTKPCLKQRLRFQYPILRDISNHQNTRKLHQWTDSLTIANDSWVHHRLLEI